MTPLCNVTRSRIRRAVRTVDSHPARLSSRQLAASLPPLSLLPLSLGGAPCASATIRNLPGVVHGPRENWIRREVKPAGSECDVK
jgi:hypothetical protein